MLGLAVLVVLAWVIDDKVAHAETVARNVVLDGEAIGGLGGAALSAAVAELATDVADDILTVDTPDIIIEARNDAAGVAVDTVLTRRAALEAGRGGGPLVELRSWLRSFVEPRTVEPRYRLDERALETWVKSEPATQHRLPREPSFTGASGAFAARRPVVGLHLAPATAAAAIEAAFDSGHSPFTIAVDWTRTRPAVRQPGLDAALAEAEAMADSGLTVQVADDVVRLGPEVVRSWIVSEHQGDRLVPVFDDGAVRSSLEGLLSDHVDEGTPPTFAIVDGEVEIEYGVPPRRCCGPEAGDILYEAVTTGHDGPVALPLVRVDDEETQAGRLGIQEIVGEFTTNHACCESRVENIHRIADIVRGALILPGERFSINEFVGSRTSEKGFVPAGTIQHGRFEDGIGGGISQFATTMFNAAFFAGLDFDEYRAHSIYISRYPRGREATLSYPHPDLAVVNNTPFGMLVWTEYDDTSITVQLWSTPFFEVEENGQDEFRWGAACTRVDTHRRRTDPDGNVLEDTVFAIYRPGEGIDCNGDPTPQP